MVDLAHEAGLPVAAHAHAAEAIDLVVRIGVETIEHATYVGYGDVPSTDIVGGFLNSRASDEQLAALAAGSALVCATFGGFTVEMLKNAPPVLQQRVAESGLTPQQIVDRREHVIARMNAAGVRFVGGSDAGIAPAKAHGRYPTSVIDLGRIIGAMPSLVASTSTAAQVCGLGDSKGRLRTGYDADLLVVAGDLASDLGLLWQIRQVVLRGATSSPASA